MALDSFTHWAHSRRLLLIAHREWIQTSGCEESSCRQGSGTGARSHLPASATTMRASMKPRVVTRDSRCSSDGMKYVYPATAPPGHADTCTATSGDTYLLSHSAAPLSERCSRSGRPDTLASESSVPICRDAPVGPTVWQGAHRCHDQEQCDARTLPIQEQPARPPTLVISS